MKKTHRENLLFILFNNRDIVYFSHYFIIIITLISVQQNQICCNYSVHTIMKRKLNYSIHMIVVGVEHQHLKH